MISSCIVITETAYLGCFENSNNIILRGTYLHNWDYQTNPFMTVEHCVSSCDALDFDYAGLETGFECYCDSILHQNLTERRRPESECNLPCPLGTAFCGGNYRLSLYQINVQVDTTVAAINVRSTIPAATRKPVIKYAVITNLVDVTSKSESPTPMTTSTTNSADVTSESETPIPMTSSSKTNSVDVTNKVEPVTSMTSSSMKNSVSFSTNSKETSTITSNTSIEDTNTLVSLSGKETSRKPPTPKTVQMYTTLSSTDNTTTDGNVCTCSCYDINSNAFKEEIEKLIRELAIDRRTDDACYPNPCSWRERCVRTTTEAYVCLTISTPCDDVICQNGGTCKNGPSTFTCQCVEGFNGTFCEEEFLKVRLVNGVDSLEGRVEIYINGTWGTICDDEFGDEEASVICGMLGYNETGSVPYIRAYFGEGYGSIVLDDLNCIGTETDIFDCQSGGLFQHNCAHSEDAGVVCQEDFMEVRLVDGNNSLEGRVEIYVNGIWGTICDDGFGDEEASVICGMLGYHNARSVPYSKAHFGEGYGSIVLDDLNCIGTETDIFDCQSDGLFNIIVGIAKMLELPVKKVSIKDKDQCTYKNVSVENHAIFINFFSRFIKTCVSCSHSLALTMFYMKIKT
ncbi:Antigen WC1.1,Scavenger receptor cysteine-rich domain superfamily protein,Neurotrypsin,Scavenger receptor cysteine-rich type 1 protein M160,Scavenger receptor cysteine-rich type 1 protein M130,Deleted in malignant brain tumors 1 protein [Mytilus edulis]|uniref:Uncharacterized protein n=1 Tax=Mytilus edulis TaxID=6550 RepID=A0A8S3U4T0_MYTED|nr:Antigen WC1.1,Scavenger receptor cysteine-rich domain superfamily protein,Neurotrypsin,Scavenger receptor cysteine-rich type 1 protein M160,Scavenger receptor cysteine-rich type 1 protein M130,Deleted in malignant brain tumors 1 protein [Mytilus edulis]